MLSTIQEMEFLKQVVLNNARILAAHNLDDKYFTNQAKYAEKYAYYFEPYLVIVWAGIKLRPKKILEIGTRNGHSLSQLLSMYHKFDDVKVICFDIWKEIGDPESVKNNLKIMNIPTHFIEFISGDSTITIPQYKMEYPDTKFDYVLVDGGHEKELARTDLNNIVDMVTPGGILIFDDVGSESYQLIDIWREFQANYYKEFHWFENLWRKGVAWAIKK